MARDFQPNSKAEKDYKAGLNFNDPELKQILIGTLLGDASMSIKDDKPVYSIKFDQSAAHEKYIDHLFVKFQKYCGSSPEKRYVLDKITKEKNVYKSLFFRTYTLNFLKYYFDLFYTYETQYVVTKTSYKTERGGTQFKRVKVTKKVNEIINKKKIVPKCIETLLTKKAVAYWYMDDGTYHDNQKSGKRSYLFSTQGFEKSEVERLCEVLKKKFNICANVHKDKEYWRIYILSKSSQTFVDLIKDDIIQNFQYKLEESQQMIEVIEKVNE